MFQKPTIDWSEPKKIKRLFLVIKYKKKLIQMHTIFLGNIKFIYFSQMVVV